MEIRVIKQTPNQQQSADKQISIISGNYKNDSIVYNYPNMVPIPITIKNNNNYVDEKFELESQKLQKNVIIKRLTEIFTVNTSLFIDLKNGKELSQPTLQKINVSKPTYLSQLNILPFDHFRRIIQPAFINPEGYYNVVVLKDGVLVKEVIDDTFYYDENGGCLYTHPELQNYPWVHILIKVWAKIKGGYKNLYKSQPFEFIRTFSFPDWQIINPQKQNKEYIIKKLSKATNKNQLIIAKTKNNNKVGYYGFSSNCSSFIVNGHYQQYGDLYIKLIPFVFDQWNMMMSSQRKTQPEEMPILMENQFMIPLEEFCNIFHLLYSTTNKYYPMESKGTQHFNSPNMNFQQKVSLISYEKYPCNINSIIYDLQIESKNDDYKYIQIGLSIYYPRVKNINYENNTVQEQKKQIIPWCKFMLGRINDASNMQVKYMESVQQIVMDPGQNQLNFVMRANRYEYVAGQYFKGYSHYMTKNLVLKTGKYLMSIKIQHQKLQQYEYYLNMTAINGSTKLTRVHHEQNEWKLLMQDCLFKKAVDDKKFLTFINPIRKGSWISCRNQYNVIGYSYIAVHVVKNNFHNIVIHINTKLLKKEGYIVKNPKNYDQYNIVVRSDQNALVVLKHDDEWQGKQKRKWLPPGIQFRKILKQKK